LSVSKYELCKILKDALESDPELRVRVHEHEEGCNIQFTPNVLVPREHLAQVTSGVNVRESGPIQKVYAELLIPGCSTPKMGQMFLVSPSVDLCSPGCEIEQVHFHGGRYPSAHVHVSCDFSKIAVKRHCAEKIAYHMLRLAKFSKESCTVED